MSEIPSRHSAGGRARAAKLSPEERKAIASKAARARWSGDKPARAGKPRWADLEAQGWRRVSVRLSPSAAARLDALIAAYGWDADEAIRRLLNMGDPPAILKPAGLKVAPAALRNVPALVGSPMPSVRPVVSRFNPQPKPGKAK